MRRTLVLVAVVVLGAAAAASEARRPTAGEPDTVATAAAAQTTSILCRRAGSRSRAPRRHPRRCQTLGRRDSYAEAANLAELTWKHWGTPIATGRGIERGWHLPLQHIPVRIRAYRRRSLCPGGDLVYTRMRVTSRHGSLLVKYRNCGG